jgi:hypothetical protein
VTRLIWSSRQLGVGLDRGVLYPKNAPGESWSGLVSVDAQSDADVKVRYFDGVRIGSHTGLEDFSGTIEAFTYPEALDQILAQHQNRAIFDLSYRIQTRTSYEIHLVYNVLAIPAGHIYQHSQVDPFKWDFTTTPMVVPYAERSAHLIITATDAYSWTLEALEDLLYGSMNNEPSLPSPEGIFEVFEENSILRVIDHGDGSFTVTGPDDAIQVFGDGSFEIDWPSAVYISDDHYTIHSL